jgi:hypothetical protein
MTKHRTPIKPRGQCIIELQKQIIAQFLSYMVKLAGSQFSNLPALLRPGSPACCHSAHPHFPDEEACKKGSPSKRKPSSKSHPHLSSFALFSQGSLQTGLTLIEEACMQGSPPTPASINNNNDDNSQHQQTTKQTSRQQQHTNNSTNNHNNTNNSNNNNNNNTNNHSNSNNNNRSNNNNNKQQQRNNTNNNNNNNTNDNNNNNTPTTRC